MKLRMPALIVLTLILGAAAKDPAAGPKPVEPLMAPGLSAFRGPTGDW
jgi:hypothetical protein